MELGIPTDCKPVSGGDGDTDTGEATRSDADQNLGRDAPIEQFGDHRDQPLAMAAANQLVLACNALIAVEQSGGAGCA